MKDFVPYEKLSKKQKKAIDRARRNTWGNVRPATVANKNGKAYDRKKAREWDDLPERVFLFHVEHSFPI